METKEFLTTIGERIRAARKAKKISQERLAEMADLHPSYMSEIELGKTNASIYSYYRIATALGIPFGELVNISVGKPDKKTDTELAELLSLMRALPKKKQSIFLTAARGLLDGVRASK